MTIRAFLGTSLLAAGLALVAAPAVQAEGQVVAVGWGGVWQEAYRKALFGPFQAASGVTVVEEEFGGEYAKVAAQVESGQIIWDLAPFESPQVIQGCDEGVFVKLDWDKLGGRDKQIPWATHDCGIASDIWATVMTWDADKVTAGPTSWAEFWDVTKFPGQRGAYKDARIMIEVALAADGVAKDDMYSVLATPEGMDRAFAKLDELKPYLVWSESPADGMQRLLAGDVALAINFNARVTGAARDNSRNLAICWDCGFWVGVDYWVQIAGSPNPDQATTMLAFYAKPETQAELVKHLSYGVPTLAAYDLMTPELRAELPTAPDKLPRAMVYSDDFWVENLPMAVERFNTWLAQ